MPRFKEKHVERLLKGKRSWKNIGSKSMPHHLLPHERKKFDIAIKKRFLVVDSRERINVRNNWDKYCESKKWLHIVITHYIGKGTLYVDNDDITHGDLKGLKLLAKSILTKHQNK